MSSSDAGVSTMVPSRGSQLRQGYTKIAAERDRALAEHASLSRKHQTAKETAKQAKVALDAGAHKIERLDQTLAEERQARTLAERAAHVDEPRASLKEAQEPPAGKPEG